MEVTLPVLSEEDCPVHKMDPRLDARKAVSLRTIVADKAGLATAEVTNLSERGCGLRLAKSLTRRQYLTLKVYPNDGTVAVQIDLAMVKWIEEDVAGVEFLSLTKENQLRLSALRRFCRISLGGLDE